MKKPDWKHRLKSLVDIKRDEVSQTFLMFAYNFLIIASHTIVKSIRDASFIHDVGVDKLPYVYIGIALIAGLVMQAYGRLAQRTKRNHLIIGSNLFFITNILVFWWLFRYKWLWLGYGLYIWAGIFSAISVAQFWLIANNIFNPRQAKRLFGFILSGGTLGGIFAGILSQGIVDTIGTENLFLVTALQVLGCAIIMSRINLQELVVSARDSSSTSSSDQDTGGAFALIRKNRHLKLLAMIIGITVLATTLIDFQFKNIIQRSYDTKDALTGFFGSYYAYINIVTVLFQILVTGKVLKRFGVGIAIMVMPVGLFLGSSIILFAPVFWAAVLVKTCDDVFSLSINKWSTEILYIPIPASVKLKAKTFIDVAVERASRGIGGLLLLFLTLAISLNVSQLSIPALALLVIWIFLCVYIYREYIASIEATLQKRSLNIDTLDVDLSDSSTINQLFPLLEGKSERQTIYALELLQDVRNPELLERIQPLCHHPSPEVRVKALRILFNIGVPGLESQIDTLLEDEDEEVRTEAMHYISTYGEVPATQFFRSFLEHPDYKMRSAAITCITRYGNDEERALLTQELIEQMLLEKGPHCALSRLGAAKALGAMTGNPNTQDYLLELFNDENVDVVKQAILSAGKSRCLDFVPFLVKKLGDSTIRVPAREALVTCGPDILDTLEHMMTDKQMPVSIRRHIPKVICMIPHQDSVYVLLNHLEQNEMDMRYKTIRALEELRGLQIGLQFDTKLVRKYVASGLRDYYRLKIILEAQNEQASHFLKRSLQERLRLFEEMIFRLLGLIYPQKSIYNAYRGVISYYPRVRANAVELLDNILGRSTKQMLFPIIDNSSKAVFMERASALWDLHPMVEKEAITALISGPDEWLKACALHTLGERKITALQEYVKEARGSSVLLIRESAELAWRKLELDER